MPSSRYDTTTDATKDVTIDKTAARTAATTTNGAYIVSWQWHEP